jgi:hypothetical protein
MATINVPDYEGGSIVNLTAEIETRLTGSAPGPRLHSHLGERIPEAAGYVLVVFDGLGSGQLGHSAAAPLARSSRADLDTPFPATTTVSLASLATGLPPSRHGLLGYQLWLPEADTVVNTIKWTTLWGAPIEYDTTTVLPALNLWERLQAAGSEPVTVQPAQFDRSALTKALYRGCRFEPAFLAEDLVEATVRVAGPGRLVMTYVPHIDFAAHVSGQSSREYADALTIASHVWSALSTRLPASVALVGTADHGHVDFPRDRQHKIPKTEHEGRAFYGDGRAMFVKGDGAPLAEALPATWIPGSEARAWWGPGPFHETFEDRSPDGILLADDDTLILHRFSDDRMIGNHGGMTPAEQKVPLLVRR